MPSTTASIIGSSGLIGGALLQQLLADPHFSALRTIVRKPSPTKHDKQEEKLIDFRDPENFKLAIDGSDVVFCTVGTTQKKVKGDKAAYRRVDFDIPVQAAKFCKETGCPVFVLISSVGANADSGNFYLKLKGEVEEAVKTVGINSVYILRPSMLLGKRKESRPAEKLGQIFMQLFSFAFKGNLRKYRAVHAEEVAATMIACALESKPGFHVLEYPQFKS